MFCYTKALTEEQEKILECINNSSNMPLEAQLLFLSSELGLSYQILVSKLLHLCKNEFIINQYYFDEPSMRLGLNITADGLISAHSTEPLILTPSGLGYLKTKDSLKQIIDKAMAETNIPQMEKITIYNKIWQEIKDSGIDFWVKLTKSYINS